MYVFLYLDVFMLKTCTDNCFRNYERVGIDQLLNYDKLKLRKQDRIPLANC